MRRRWGQTGANKHILDRRLGILQKKCHFFVYIHTQKLLLPTKKGSMKQTVWNLHYGNKERKLIFQILLYFVFCGYSRIDIVLYMKCNEYVWRLSWISL